MSQMMSAGGLNRQIQIMSVSQTQDAMGQPLATQTLFKTVRAQRVNVTVNDMQRAQVVGEVAEAKYLTRYHTGVINGMFVVEGANSYKIISVAEIGMQEGLAIMVKGAA